MHTDSEKLPKPICIVRFLFYLNAVIWLLLGLISLYRLGTGDNAYPVTMLVVAILMFGNVVALMLSGFMLKWPQKRWFWLGTAVLLINIILTFTDQVGLFDLLTLLLDVIILSLLIANRDWFEL